MIPPSYGGRGRLPTTVGPAAATGTVGPAMSFSIGQLKGMFENYTYQLQIECGGNGRRTHLGNQPAIHRDERPPGRGVE